MVLLLAVPLAELSPGRLRNASVALLGLLVAADAFAVGVLLVALTEQAPGASAPANCARHGAVRTGSPTSSPSGCFSGSSTRAVRASAPRAGAEHDVDFFPVPPPGHSSTGQELEAAADDYRLCVSLPIRCAVGPTDAVRRRGGGGCGHFSSRFFQPGSFWSRAPLLAFIGTKVSISEARRRHLKQVTEGRDHGERVDLAEGHTPVAGRPRLGSPGRTADSGREVGFDLVDQVAEGRVGIVAACA